MAFSEVEMSILAQLAYRDVDYKAAAEEPLYSHLKNNKEWLYKQLGDSFKPYIDNLINKVEDQDYIIVDSQKDTLSGFSAFAVSTPENEVVVACRGTQELNDWLTDAGIGITVETQQHREMREFVNRLENKGYEGFYFTGHSLGGNLATHGAVTVDDPSKVRGVYAYNSPGFNEGYWALHGEKLQKLQFCITNYQNEYDYVSSILRVPGRKVIIASSVTSGHLLFDDHSISGYEIDENGFFAPNETGSKRAQTYAGSALGEFGQNLAFSPILPHLRIYNAYKAFKYRETYRDFSAEAKEMLVGAAKETEDEHWWEVSKWDCWYKVEKFFGTLEWDLYAGNVDSYYRKLIDINDASVKDIEKIFENVYSLDSSYSSTIDDAADTLKTKVTNALKTLRESIVVN